MACGLSIIWDATVPDSMLVNRRDPVKQSFDSNG